LASFIEELNQVFRAVFDDDTIEIYPELVSYHVPGWDSFSYVTLLMSIEDHFSIEFEAREVANLPNVGALITLVEKKLVAKK